MLGTRARARLRRSGSAMTGLAIVSLLALFALFGPLAARHGPLESDFLHGVSPDGTPVGPSAWFPLGADRLFRDVLARLAYAGRLSLLISVGATSIAAAIGALVGIVAGFASERPPRVAWATLAGIAGGVAALAFGARLAAAVLVIFGVLLGRVRGASGPRVDVDGLLMRAVDALLAFPFLLLVMAVGAAFERTSAFTVFVVLGTTSWLGIARVLRAKTMQVRSREFVVASRALGQSTTGILVKHLLPNVAGTLLVLATLQVAQMMIAESVLAYLGVGVSPPTPTWGRMLFEGQEEYLVAPWLALAPGAAIVLSVWGFNLLGEGLRDALDPRGA